VSFSLELVIHPRILPRTEFHRGVQVLHRLGCVSASKVGYRVSVWAPRMQSLSWGSTDERSPVLMGRLRTVRAAVGIRRGVEVHGEIFL